MAKFIPSSTIQEIRGSVGADTFSRVKSGGIIKARSHPGSRHGYSITPKQATININFGKLAPAWQDLTDAQRKEWNQLSTNMGSTNVFGGHYTQSGFNFFTSLNYNLSLCGNAFLTDPPTKVPIFQLQKFYIMQVNLPIPRLLLSFPSVTTGTYTSHFVYASEQVSAGVMSCTSRYRLITTIPPGSSDYYDVSAAYIATFGNLQSGMKIFFKLRPVQTQTGFSAIVLYNSIILS